MKEKKLKCRGTFQRNTRKTDTTVTLKSQKGITLIALVITMIVHCDKFIKHSNNNGFLLSRI